jgi:hypothetical protein
MSKIDEYIEIIKLLEDRRGYLTVEINYLQDQLSNKKQTLLDIEKELTHNQKILDNLKIESELENVTITLEEFIRDHTFRVTINRDWIVSEFGEDCVAEIEVEGKTYFIENDMCNGLTSHYSKKIRETGYNTDRTRLDYNTSFTDVVCPQCGSYIRLCNINDYGTVNVEDQCETCFLYYTKDGELYSVVRNGIQPQIADGAYLIYEGEIYLINSNHKSMTLFKRFKGNVK